MRGLSVLWCPGWYLLLLASPTRGQERRDQPTTTTRRRTTTTWFATRSLLGQTEQEEPMRRGIGKGSHEYVPVPQPTVIPTTVPPTVVTTVDPPSTANPTLATLTEPTVAPLATTKAPQTQRPTSGPTFVPLITTITPQTEIPTAVERPNSFPTSDGSEPTDGALPSPSTEPIPPVVRCGIEDLDIFWNGLDESANTTTSSVDGAFSSDSMSYQCRALRRVTEQEGYQNFSFRVIVQYWVLYCIYFATNGDSVLSSESRRLLVGGTWVNVDGWQNTTVDPCSGWYGLMCDSTDRVTELYLANNGLHGVFPREVRYLSLDGPYSTGAGDLQKLHLFNNEFLTNDDSTWIVELGSRLRVLHYGSTAFQGPLPDLPLGIEEYDCSYALHSGVIPDEVFQGLNNLTILIMDGNNFVSAIPKSITTLPNLKYFYVRDAGLTGDLSYMTHGMPSIVEHLVDGNPGLSGSIPTSLATLTTLRSFSASDCSLTGTLPTELGDLSSMVQLWLFGNALTGPIPSQYARMTALRILALEDTELTGVVPIDLCLQRYNGALTTLSTDCVEEVHCTTFFPDCCTCCDRSGCAT